MSIISDYLARGGVLADMSGAGGARPGSECSLPRSEHRCVLRDKPANLGEVRGNAPVIHTQPRSGRAKRPAHTANARPASHRKESSSSSDATNKLNC